MSKTLPIGALKVNDEVMVCGPHKPLKHQIGVTHQVSDFSDMPVSPPEYGQYPVVDHGVKALDGRSSRGVYLGMRFWRSGSDARSDGLSCFARLLAHIEREAPSWITVVPTVGGSRSIPASATI
jgi:hypothetical protein